MEKIAYIWRMRGCGLCGVKPRGRAPILDLEGAALPEDLTQIGQQKGLWVAVVPGQGIRHVVFRPLCGLIGFGSS